MAAHINFRNSIRSSTDKEGVDGRVDGQARDVGYGYR